LNQASKHRVSIRYNIREESLQPFMLKDLKLLLEFSSREVTLALIHRKSGKLMFLNNLSIVSSGNADLPDFAHIMAEHIALLENVHQIVFSWKTPEFTLVPMNLFSEENISQLLRAGGCDPEQDELCLSTEAAVADYRIVYSLPKKIVETLNPYKDKLRTFPSCYALLNSALQTARNNDQRIVLINVFDEAFEMVVAEPRKILFCNSFPFRSPEDFVYFLLMVTENLNVSNEKDMFFFCGQIEKKSTVFQLCNKYIRNTNWINRDEALDFSSAFSALPAHFFYTYFQLFHCE